jgi:hypothetical protein
LKQNLGIRGFFSLLIFCLLGLLELAMKALSEMTLTHRGLKMEVIECSHMY